MVILQESYLLRKAFSSKDHDVEILSRGKFLPLNSFKMPFNIKISNWLNNEDTFLKVTNGSDFIVVDAVNLTEQYFNNMKKLRENIVFIDDYFRWRHNKGIIIDWTIGSEKNKNRISDKRAKFLLGSRYVCLRNEFKYVPERVHTDKINNIMVTFGGGDIRNMTLK